MKIKIHITKDILQRSMMCSTGNVKQDMVGQNCAVALAIVKLFGYQTWVSSFDIYFFKKGNNVFTENGSQRSDYADYNIHLPSIASSFIKLFDGLSETPEKRLELPELSFDIDVPNEIINQIGISEAIEILSNSKSLELIEL